jgi:hypothetical protein
LWGIIDLLKRSTVILLQAPFSGDGLPVLWIFSGLL